MEPQSNTTDHMLVAAAPQKPVITSGGLPALWYHVALELPIAFVPSVLAFACSFTTGSGENKRHS